MAYLKIKRKLHYLGAGGREVSLDPVLIRGIHTNPDLAGTGRTIINLSNGTKKYSSESALDLLNALDRGGIKHW